MPYDELADRLSTPLDPVRVGAFPDGSVDDYHRIRAGESSVDSREAFAAEITAGRDSFVRDHVATDAGGQSVNAARQAAALGDDVCLAGHLDHAVFDFDFETVSMGAPASVHVTLFDADDVMFVEESADLETWSFAELRAALGERLDTFLERDALCCTNWASVPGLGSAFDEIAARDPDGNVFCVDPGPISTAQAGDLLDALERLDGAYDTVLSVNEDEAGRLAETVDRGDADPTSAAALDAIRAAASAAGVVVHGVDAATATTPDGRVSVPTLETERTLTETGAGDRFSGGLARSLGAGWEWDVALAMGNACAGHYVSGQGTGGVAELRDRVLADRPR
ncbi:Sugar or nucleoside kinase, ribokinase family [Haloplanus vescus]|uniref:Sugar or nucleoside kinase, ribokinase family n=1 Tax=Haloplanus vescus TaxID=555874 RepID=A0A1H3VM15_9EURY|nr:carbohydrate kinase family protein [Haloplanus vescus]SDZ75294.1 Sugar or nucleoside kinase, ribokinase family [Haloplanus vescus]